RWVRNFRFINYCDSFDGHHPHVFVPTDTSPRAFESIEEICREFWGVVPNGSLTHCQLAP
ncbi:MAG: hypothetical protein ACXVY5_04250, partial [Gaiellales bacterium]